jgi:hypothetical protein
MHKKRSVSGRKPSETWRVLAARFVESGCSGRLLEVAKQLRKGNSEADRQHFEDAETGFPAPILQLGDMDAANSLNLSQIRLIPAPIGPQLS